MEYKETQQEQPEEVKAAETTEAAGSAGAERKSNFDEPMMKKEEIGDNDRVKVTITYPNGKVQEINTDCLFISAHDESFKDEDHPNVSGLATQFSSCTGAAMFDTVKGLFNVLRQLSDRSGIENLIVAAAMMNGFMIVPKPSGSRSGIAGILEMLTRL